MTRRKPGDLHLVKQEPKFATKRRISIMLESNAYVPDAHWDAIAEGQAQLWPAS